MISTANFVAPAGSFIENGRQINVLFQNKVESIDDIQNLEINDELVLSDVASVEVKFNNQDQYNRIGYAQDESETLDIERALLFGVQIKSDADILVISDYLEELVEGYEEGKLTIVYSQAESTRLQIEEITQSIFGKPIDTLGPFAFIGYLLGGLGFVTLLLFFFMNIRVAIMAALAIPASLFSAAIYLNFVGIDLNTLVLFAMVLVIGLVVDPTIVFLESMQRYIEEGKNGKEAAVKTVETVGLGVFLAVLTNILVFVPFGLVSGFFGEIIKYIPATVIPAMIASMLIPIVFLMPLSAKIMKPRKKTIESNDELAATWKLGMWMRNGLKKLLKKGKKIAVLRIAVFLFVLALPMLVGFGLTSSGAVQVVQFSSSDDSDFLIINGDIAADWTFEKAVYDVVVPLQDELATYPEIQHFFYFEQSGNSFMIIAQLLPIPDREDAEMRTATDLARAMNDGIAELELDAEIRASADSEGPPQDEFPVSLRIFEDDADLLEAAIEDIAAYLDDREDVDIVNTSFEEVSSGGTIVLDFDKGSSLPSPMIAFGVARGVLAETELGSLTLDGTKYELRSSNTITIESESELLDLEVMPKIPSPFPGIPGIDAQTLEDVTIETEKQESITIQRSNGRRVASLNASVFEDIDPLTVQSELEAYLSDEKLDELGIDRNSLDFEGVADSIGESFSDLFTALLISIFLIYVILVGFFRSFFEPIIILFAIPLGLVGVFFAVAATTGQLGFLELLGVVAMAGIVVNVTILLLDNANQMLRAGRSPADAISTAVGLRLRPIVLTQLTAFGSLIPLVYLSPFWKGLAAAIIFGIISSALLALVVVPILYLWAHSLPDMFGKIMQKIKSRLPRLRRTK